MPYEPKHLKLWTMPNSYCGAVWPDYYSSGFGQSRDPDALERANFDAVRAALDAIPEPADWDDDEPPFQVVRESHWAVGWVEWIAIHQYADAHLQCADKIRASYENYPVVDDELFSRYEDEDCAQTWESCYSPTERLNYIRSHGHCRKPGIAPLLRAVRGNWHEAANILNCPSELIN